MDTWSLAFTDANGRVGKKTYDNETAFISGVLEKLTGLRTSNISAVLPDGTELDEQALRDRFMPHGFQTAPSAQHRRRSQRHRQPVAGRQVARLLPRGSTAQAGRGHRLGLRPAGYGDMPIAMARKLMAHCDREFASPEFAIVPAALKGPGAFRSAAALDAAASIPDRRACVTCPA